jgi:hypothetical protein
VIVSVLELTGPLKVIVNQAIPGPLAAKVGVNEKVTGMIACDNHGTLPFKSHCCITLPRLRPVVAGKKFEFTVPIVLLAFPQ